MKKKYKSSYKNDPFNDEIWLGMLDSEQVAGLTGVFSQI